MSTCDYEYRSGSVDFKCLELVHNREITRCIFHDVNYLKWNSNQKYKEEVVNRFKRKLSKYGSNDMDFKFFGYCLPDISFEKEEFSKELYFNDATFYVVRFAKATFSKGANFNGGYILKRSRLW